MTEANSVEVDPGKVGPADHHEVKVNQWALLHTSQRMLKRIVDRSVVFWLSFGWQFQGQC